MVNPDFNLQEDVLALHIVADSTYEELDTLLEIGMLCQHSDRQMMVLMLF